MSYYFRLPLLIALIAALLLPVGVQAASPVSDANPPGGVLPPTLDAPAWYDGSIQESVITNCVSIIQGNPYSEYGAGTYAGFLANPNSGQPAPNTTYYIHVVIAGLGNSCSGMRAYLDVALPASTSLAINAGTPVYCLYDGVQIAPASDCPQSLPASTYNPGAFAIWSTDAAHAHTWPVPQGHTLEFQIPVQSSTALSNSTLQANVWMIDGNSSPWLRPQEGVYVFGSQPTIIYPSPSTNAMTTTSAHSQAYLYAYNTTGTGYFDLGTTAAYGLIHEAVSISTPGTAWLVYDDWAPPALTPGTLYHWRFTYTTGATTYYGADQTFRTVPLPLTIKSAGAYDGWILESTETSGVGGTMNAAANTFQLGDDAANRQYRAILSFNTAGLPDNAVVTSAQLKIKQNGLPVGTNPFNILGNLFVDIRRGPFGVAGLQLTDFNSAATAAKVGFFNKIPVGGWYTSGLNANGRNNINKLGLTQFRLYFAVDDNNNHIADYMRFLSGNFTSGQPMLVITYTVP